MKHQQSENELPIFLTKHRELLAWARKNALWPYPFGTACCGIEYMSVVGPKYDIARFGAEVVRFSPRQADRAYHVVQGVDRIIPVDVYIAGCPPTPEAVIAGLMTLQDKISADAKRPAQV
jgi:NADH-quinone oxidoreductase subunit B